MIESANDFFWYQRRESSPPQRLPIRRKMREKGERERVRAEWWEVKVSPFPSSPASFNISLSPLSAQSINNQKNISLCGGERRERTPRQEASSSWCRYKFKWTSLRWEWLPRLPSQRFVINTLDDTEFGGKVDFCGGRRTGEKPSESDWDQPITAHVRARMEPRW